MKFDLHVSDKRLPASSTAKPPQKLKQVQTAAPFEFTPCVTAISIEITFVGGNICVCPSVYNNCDYY